MGLLGLLGTHCGGGTTSNSVDSGTQVTDGETESSTGPVLVVTIQDVDGTEASLGKSFFKSHNGDPACIDVNAYNADTGELCNSAPGCRDPEDGKARVVMDQCADMEASAALRFEAILASGAILVSFDEVSAASVVANRNNGATEIESANPVNVTTTLAVQQMLSAAGCEDYASSRITPTECRGFDTTLSMLEELLQDDEETSAASTSLKKMQTIISGCALQGIAGGCENPAFFLQQVMNGTDSAVMEQALQFAAFAGEEMTSEQLSNHTAMVRSVPQVIGPILFGDATLRERLVTEADFKGQLVGTVRQWSNVSDASAMLGAGSAGIQNFARSGGFAMPPDAVIEMFAVQSGQNYSAFADTAQLGALVTVGTNAVSSEMTREQMRTKMEFAQTVVVNQSADILGQTDYWTQIGTFARINEVDPVTVDSAYVTALTQQVQTGGTLSGFTNESFIDGGIPSISSRSPAVGASNVALGSAVSIVFSLDIDATTLGNVQLLLNGDAVSVTRSLQGLRTLTLTPSSSLQADKTYTVSIGSGLKSAAGKSVVATSWGFDTALSTFRIVSYSPACDSTNNPTNTPLSVTFSHPLDISTATTANLAVSGCDSSSILGGVVLSNSNKTITRTPGSPYLNTNATCSWNIASVKDGSDRSLGSVDACTPQTGNGVDITAPVFSGLPPGACSSVNATTISCSYSEASDAVSAANNITYKAYVVPTSGAQNYSAVTAQVTGSTTLSISPLFAGTTWYAVVRACDQTNNCDTNTTERSVATPSLTAPLNPIATAISTTRIDLSWDSMEADGVTTYRAYYSTTTPVSTDSSFVIISGATSWSHTGLSSSTRYYYKVAGVAGDVGPLSLETSVQTLDPSGVAVNTFGTSGIYQSDSHVSSVRSVLDDAGNIIVGGYASGGGDMLVGRLTSAGVADTTFSGDGFDSQGLGIAGGSSTSIDYVNDVAVDSGGKVWAVGTLWDGTGWAAATIGYRGFACRYNSNGTLDATMTGGTGCTRLEVASGAWKHSYAKGILIHPTDGYVYVVGAGTDASDFQVLALWKLNGSDGSVAGTFTRTGADSQSYLNDVIADGNGKLLVTGTDSSAMQLWRYNTNGSLDTNFSDDGLVSSNPFSAASGNAVTTDASGNVLVTGSVRDASFNYDMAVWRYTSSGVLDTNFSGDGLYTYHGNNSDFGRDLVVAASGKIYVAGSVSRASVNNGMGIWKFNTNGTLDTTFSDDGIVEEPASGNTNGYSIAIDSGGKLIVAGEFQTKLAVWRYWP